MDFPVPGQILFAATNYLPDELFPLFPSLNNKFIAVFVFLPGFFAKRRLAPRSFWMFESHSLASFPSAVRMINRIHGRPPDSRPPPQMAAFPGLPDIYRAVLKITDLADRSITGIINQSYLSG